MYPVNLRQTRISICLLLHVSVCVSATAAASTTLAQGQAEFAAGRLLVMAKAGVPQQALEKMVGEAGGQGVHALSNSRIQVIDVPPGNEVAIAQRLSHNPHFRFAELDRRVTATAVPNDPYYGSAWHLSKIKAADAWSASTGQGVTIAVLDTGLDASHPDLAGRVVAGWNFYDNNANTSDVNGHGTAVAGTAAATLNNGLGVAAVAGQAGLMPVRIADANAYAYWSTVAQGLTWAADHGARIANISYVGLADSQAVLSAANYMRSKGGLVFVAAGNNNRDEGYAANEALIPVSATDSADAKASFSSWGSFVALSAPGVDVWTTVRGGGYQTWWGTSIASPVAAGVAALVMSRNPGLTNTQVESILFSTAVDLGVQGRDAVFGYGRVDAAAAVAAASPSVTPAPALDTQAPTVDIGTPLGNSTVSGLAPVTVNATDNIGVTKVELRAGGVLVATETTAPFSFSWNSTQSANGIVNLVAKAFDAAGNSRDSATVSVNVANLQADTTPPVIVFNSPTTGASLTGNVQISITATDNSGAAGIRQTLFINGKQFASSSGGTLNASWNTRKSGTGSFTLLATARDAAGNQSSSQITVTLR